jgi:hypothetical protein
MNASDNTPSSGECVSDEQYDTSASAAQFFTMAQDIFEDRMVQARKAIRDGDGGHARTELQRIQEDCEVLKELVSDE